MEKKKLVVIRFTTSMIIEIGRIHTRNNFMRINTLGFVRVVLSLTFLFFVGGYRAIFVYNNRYDDRRDGRVRIKVAEEKANSYGK